MAHIKILSDEIINQIAAGEIVENPASVVKELVENSIDAGSTIITIFLQNAGRTKLIVEDNGNGIDDGELSLAVQRHATSKLSGTNLFNICSYGFRGEALPSIASVSRFSIESNGSVLHIDFGGAPRIMVSSTTIGTRVVVQDIFDRIPARLKFLRSDNIELSRCLELIESFAIVQPNIQFVVQDNTRTILSFTKNDQKNRIAEIVGDEVISRSIYIEEFCEMISIHGYLCHPIDSVYSQSSQRIFINKRWIKDKTISSAIKSAFKDLLPVGRFANCILFVNIDPFCLDVNVSPSKSEVRFRDVCYVRKFITDSIRKNLYRFDRVSLCANNSKLVISHDNANNIKVNPRYSIIKKVEDSTVDMRNYLEDNLARKTDTLINDVSEADNVIHIDDIKFCPQESPLKNKITSSNNIKSEIYSKNECIDVPTLNVDHEYKGFWGEPIGQLLDTYIICKTDSEIVIIDQHAVHEKIMMQKILRNINISNSQYLTHPEVLPLTRHQFHVANEIHQHLKQCGFNAEIKSNTITITAIPGVLKLSDLQQFLYDLFEDPDIINEHGTENIVKLKIANVACHNSIRAGRKLTINEMKAIIREMEITESVHQCNHHRPCFIKINERQLASIFKRT